MITACGPRFVEQLAILREHARIGVRCGDRIDIDVRDADQIVVAVLIDLAQMLASDQPRADHADSDTAHFTSCTGTTTQRRWLYTSRHTAPSSTSPLITC